MTKASSRNAPPLVGPLNRNYLAYVFGSSDGSVAGIANKFERARCEARIRHHERIWENWRNHVAATTVSVDDALSQIHRRYDAIEQAAEKAIQRPLLCRDKREELLTAFPEKNND